MVLTDTILSNVVTYQDYVSSKNLKNISIGNFIFSIKNERYNNDISKLREYYNNNKRMYHQEKTRLPSIAFSGLFSETRRIESLVEYNNVCIIDIDTIPTQDIQKYLNVFYSDPFIFSFWLSPSGRGIKGLVKFKYTLEPSISASYENHKFAFSELNNYIKEKYNIEIDKSGSDVTRLCFVSSDSNLVLKEQAEEFPIDNQNISILVPTNSRRKSSSKSSYFILKEHMSPVGKNKQSKRTKIQQIIKFLRKRNISITSTYESWYRVAYSISSTFTYDLGEKYYLQLCRLDGSKHSEEQSIAMLQYCYVNSKRTISFGTIQFYFNKLKEVRGSRTEEVSSKIDP
jgi:hypothetical protein